MSEASSTIPLPWEYDDGGREAAGFKGSAGDCAARAVSIALGVGYDAAYESLRAENVEYADTRSDRIARAIRKSGPTPRNGIYREVLDALLARHGWTWTPTMRVGQGATTHLAVGEVPDLCIARVSKHFVAVVDGVMRDTGDPSRGGTRAVYGYWTPGR